MKTRVLPLAAAALASSILVAPAASGQTARAGETFTATAELTTKQGTRSTPLTLVVSRPLSAEAARPLRKVLESGGQQALLAAIRGGNRGRLTFGGVDYPLDLVVAEAVPEGTWYIVVTTRNFRYEEINENRPSLDFPFAVSVFMVPNFGSGEGKLYPHAALSVSAEGHVQVSQYEDQPGRLKDISRSRR